MKAINSGDTRSLWHCWKWGNTRDDDPGWQQTSSSNGDGAKWQQKNVVPGHQDPGGKW
jgi:hypothetical protein